MSLMEGRLRDACRQAPRPGRKAPPLNSDEQVEKSEQNTAAMAGENVEETGEAREVEREADAQEADVQPEAAVEKPAKTAGVVPAGDQLVTARAGHWHQDGQALLTMEALREWLQRSGLVLYGPKPQLGAPAPTWVEATLGKAEAAPELGATDAARTLLARLIAEGAAVPLNLLGVTGAVGTDVPDFVASASVFSYIFTLRGNKAWKQMPVTSGAVKVSPLALATYEMLSAKVTLSAYDLATQLGKEVTEGAVLRALTELWSQLRVIPVPQLDGTATLWELASARFTKQIKSGANAGQPSALSALISLYLGQAMAATEDEIESFLSPLAPRSRVREVIHALLQARQLETLVVKGKTLLHVAGDAPAFAAALTEELDRTARGGQEAKDGSRISKFAAKPGSKLGTGLRSKPAFGKKPYGAKPAYGAKPSFDRGGDRERRPFRREDRAGERPAASNPSFDKPWNENVRNEATHPRFEGRVEGLSGESNAAGESRPPRREFTAREGAGPRKSFSKPGTFGRKREGFGSGEGRPPRRDAGGAGERGAAGGFKRPGSYAPRPGGGERTGFGGKPAFGGKPSLGAKPGFGRSRPDAGEGGEAPPRKVFRKFDAPRSPKPFGAKPGGGKFFGGRTAGRDRPQGAPSDRPARTFSDRPAGSFGARPERPARSFDAGGERPKRAFDGPRAGGAGRPSFGAKPFGERPSGDRKPGGFGGKKPFAKAGGASGAKGASGPFAKFADGKKPFRKPGPGKTTDRPASSGGGYRPTKRSGLRGVDPDGGEGSGREKPVIAIDGPAGAGKSTLAAHLARRFGFLNLETGAMYRALAYKAIDCDLDLDEETRCWTCAGARRLRLNRTRDGNRVLLDGMDVSRRIRDGDVTAAASRASVHPLVRDWMVAQQRALGAAGGVVMEGRDIGTAVFPDAEVKIFLDAAPEVRGNRRFRQVAVERA